MRSRGLSGYVSEPQWTGNEMTTVSGKVAGPYPSGDVMRYWYSAPPQARAAGLQRIAKGKYTGMGDLCTVYNDDGSCAAYSSGDFSSDLPPGATITTTPTVYVPVGGGSSGSSGGSSSSSSGFSFGNFLNTLLGDSAKLTSQAIGSGGTLLPNGNILLPSGQVIAGTPASSGISSSTLLIGALLIGGVVLVASMKK